MDKKINIIIAVIVVAILAIGGWYLAFERMSTNNLSEAEKIELELKNTIESNIENWDLYAKVTDPAQKKFGNDATCGLSVQGNVDFLDYEKKAKAGDAYWLDLTNGAYLVYTPNYNNWDNAKLSAFGVADMRVCSSGWLIPLYAYPDKILWGNAQCAGAEEATDFCAKIHQIVMGYFTQKSR